MNIDNGYISLSRSESAAIKGILMFLIILGHNALFTSYFKGSFNYLYTFHVLCFFVLPFMYGKREQITFKESFKKNFIRLYYPYILFFITFCLLSKFINAKEFDLNKMIIPAAFSNSNLIQIIGALFTGNKYLIDYCTSFQYLWFLPVMFSMNLIKDTITNNKFIKFILYILGFISYVIFFVFVFRQPYCKEINFYLMLVSPFAIIQGLGAYFFGKASVAIMDNKYYKYINIVGSLLFIFLSFAYIIDFNNKELTIQENWCYHFIMPFLFVNLIYLSKSILAKSTLLKKIGEYSLPIYLIHPPLCVAFNMICQCFFQINLLSVIIVQILVLTVSYYISVLWYKVTPLRKKTLPCSSEDLCFNKASMIRR